MRLFKHFFVLAMVVAGVLASQARAASHTFFLTESNKYTDGINWASVLVTENAGNLDFQVNVLNPQNVSGQPTMTEFGFNIAANAGSLSVIGLNPNWNYQPNGHAFGFFGFSSEVVTGQGNTGTSSIMFTLDSTLPLSLYSIVNNTAGNALFAKLQCPQGQNCDGSVKNGQGADTHFVTTGALEPPSSVPLPAAAWLFGSALLGFVGISNRSRV